MKQNIVEKIKAMSNMEILSMFGELQDKMFSQAHFMLEYDMTPFNLSFLIDLEMSSRGIVNDEYQ